MKTFAALANAFYNLGSPFAKLAPVLSWLQRRLGKPPSLFGIEMFVAFSLSIYFFFLIGPQAAAPRASDGNESNAYLFRRLSHNPYQPKNDVGASFPVWNARLGALVVSGWIYDHGQTALKDNFEHDGGVNYFTFNGYKYYFGNIIFGFYNAAWLFLLFLLLVFHRRDALFIILGVFCGLMYNLIVPAGQWYYPWDMPAMFFFTWACLLYDKRNLLTMMIVIWIGSLFKETVICCALLVLFGAYWPLRKRLAAFTVIVLACVLTRKLLMMVYDVNTMMFALNCSTNWHEIINRPWLTLVQNLNVFAQFNLNNELFINAGVLFLVLLLPWRTRREVLFKMLIILFAAGQLVLAGGSVLVEFREWYEVLPLGWMLMLEFISQRFQILQDSRGVALPANNNLVAIPPGSVMVGSYWLMVTSLLVVCAGVYFVGNLTSNPYSFDAGNSTMSGSSSEQSSSPAPSETTNNAASAVVLQQQTLAALSNLAWMLATSSDDKVRCGSLAVQLAKRACDQTNYEIVQPIGTLAAAYAEAGQFEDAIATAKKACALASEQGEIQLLARNQELLGLYEKHQTYRQPPSPSGN
jgi:hypothetical protein